MEILNSFIRQLGFALCHQLPERSISFGGRSMPVCARDAGLLAAFFLVLQAAMIPVAFIVQFTPCRTTYQVSARSDGGAGETSISVGASGCTDRAVIHLELLAIEFPGDPGTKIIDAAVQASQSGKVEFTQSTAVAKRYLSFTLVAYAKAVATVGLR